jgi:beta-glucanase (GH16 family)
MTTWLVGVLLLSAVLGGLYFWGKSPPQSPAPRAQSPPAKSSPPPAESSPATPADGEPMPVGNIPGWREVFHDDFNGETLNRSRWRLYYGQPGGDPAGWFDPSHVTVSDGMLEISAYRGPADRGRWGTGGVSSSPGLVQTYGKYLVRFRFGAGTGISQALVLTPADGSWPPEIDFSEDNGGGRGSTLATLHYGSDDTQISHRTAVDLTQWHTLGVQWTPGKLNYTLDGRIWLTTSTSHVPSVPMAMDIQTEAWPCVGTWGVCPDVNTPAVVRLYVDWVVAYAPASRPQSSGHVPVAAQ